MTVFYFILKPITRYITLYTRCASAFCIRDKRRNKAQRIIKIDANCWYYTTVRPRTDDKLLLGFVRL